MTTNWHTRLSTKGSPTLEWRISSLEYCPHDLEIILVDGTYVRNHYDSNFSQGGNGYRYKWIPKHEIWIDWDINEDERPFIAFHECHEVKLMKRGWSYSRAHDEAKRLEDKHRHATLSDRASLPRRQVMAQTLRIAAKYLEENDLPQVVSGVDFESRELVSFLHIDAGLVDTDGPDDSIEEKNYVIGDIKLVMKYLSHPDVKSKERQKTPFPYALPSSDLVHDLREIIRDLG